jgi:putative copper resistance protein D
VARLGAVHGRAAPCYRGGVVLAFLLVWLRAAGLVGQGLALGGAVFALAVLHPARERCGARALDRTLALTGAGGLLVAVAQVAALAVLAAAFADDTRWPLDDVLSSTVGMVGLVRIAAALVVAWVAYTLRRSPGSGTRGILLLATAAALPVTGAFISHATGRTDGAIWLVGLATVHQAAAAAWVGGVVCAAALTAQAHVDTPVAWLQPFSRVAAGAVAMLALSGIALSLVYIATPAAAIGTSYGAMVLAKIVLFTTLLVLGALNHRALHGRIVFARRSSIGPASRDLVSGETSSIVFRRRVEVEAGLALVTLFLAASIASAPPAADAGAQRATVQEIRQVLTPRWPRLEAPSLEELAARSGLGDPLVERTPEETAWSEFGHNVSGLFILAMGVLAMLHHTGRAEWARHWPLLFIGLTGFVAWTLDPEGWQTGIVGFWEHLMRPEVLQHRILLLLTALFGLAEWRFRSGRSPNSRWRYVFPLASIASGALLLSHVHEVSNAKAAFLMELAHLPLGLLCMVIGWTRWLELRLPPTEAAGLSRLWGPAFALFGLLLIFYREA